MTEAESILADLFILKIPINREFSHRGIAHNILLGKQDDYQPDTLAEMNKILISQSSVIRDFLLREKYITSTNPSFEKDILTEKGEIAQQQGGHEGYNKWLSEKIAREQKEKQEENKIKWPQKNWLPLLIFTAILAPILVELFQTVTKKNTSVSQPTIQILHDTVYIHDKDTNQNVLKNPVPLTDTTNN